MNGLYCTHPFGSVVVILVLRAFSKYVEFHLAASHPILFVPYSLEALTLRSFWQARNMDSDQLDSTGSSSLYTVLYVIVAVHLAVLVK